MVNAGPTSDHNRRQTTSYPFQKAIRLASLFTFQKVKAVLISDGPSAARHQETLGRDDLRLLPCVASLESGVSDTEMAPEAVAKVSLQEKTELIK